MSDEGKKGGIPSWQKAASNTPATAPEHPTTASSEQSESTTEPKEVAIPTSSDDGLLLQKAEQFLRRAEIQQAPVEQKIAFLESKGVDRGIIDKALASTSTDSSTAAPSAAAAVTTTTAATPPPPIPPRDTTPIITYPEFLLHSTKPPPLITVKRLANTAYVALGAAATIWGAHRFLVKPMSESLTVARHDLAATAQERLDGLNERLKDVVSVDPKDNPNRLMSDDSASQADSEDSDPTELFHRDFGTQTTPDLDSENTSELAAAQNDVEQQTDSLNRVRRLCEGVVTEEENETESMRSISTTIKVLNEQLDSMIYSRQQYTNPYNYGVNMTTTAGAPKKDDDEVARMRNEIRAMKGVLLSARNFPASGRVSS